MRKWTARRSVFALVATCMAVAVGCGGSDDDGGDAAGSSSSADGGELTAKLGVVGPRTGPAPQFYWSNLGGAEIAAEDVKEKYGVDIEIVTADDQGTPEGASRAVQKLLNEDEVDVVMASPQSGQALQTADVLQRTGIPWFVDASSADIINPQADPNWGFRTAYNTDQIGDVLGEYLFAGDSPVGMVHSADAFGQAEEKSLQATAGDLGEEIVAVEEIQPGASDFTAGVRRLKQAGVKRIYMAVTSGSDTATVTKAMVQERLDPEVTLTSATILSDFGELAEPAQWKNLFFLDPRHLTKGAPVELNADYEKRYDEQPDVPTDVYQTYMAVDAYAQALAEVGDPSDREAIREAIEAIPSIEVRGDSIPKPYAPDDHEAYSDDPNDWNVFGFDAQGEVEEVGTVADCIAGRCKP